MINKVLILLSALFISWGTQAHQPDVSSTMLIDQGENKWVLQVRAAMTAFEYEVEQHFGKDAYATPEEFQKLVIQHVQEHMLITFNNTNDVVLQNGNVKLGHETSVVYEIAGTPEAIQSLEVKNSSFRDISHNQSALIVFKKGFERNQFVLDNNNDHTVKLKVGDAKFMLATPAVEKASYLPFLIGAGALLTLSIIFLAFKNKQILGANSSLQNA